jgi:hypothetical protein
VIKRLDRQPITEDLGDRGHMFHRPRPSNTTSIRDVKSIYTSQLHYLWPHKFRIAMDNDWPGRGMKKPDPKLLPRSSPGKSPYPQPRAIPPFFSLIRSLIDLRPGTIQIQRRRVVRQIVQDRQSRRSSASSQTDRSIQFREWGRGLGRRCRAFS